MAKRAERWRVVDFLWTERVCWAVVAEGRVRRVGIEVVAVV